MDEAGQVVMQMTGRAMHRTGWLAALVALAATSAVAQTLWTGERGDTCEVWKGNEIRCGVQRGATSPSAVRVTVTNKSQSAVSAKISFWRSLCGLPGEHGKDQTLDLAPGASSWSQVNYQAHSGNFCVEAFVSCGAAKCADALSVSASVSGGG